MQRLPRLCFTVAVVLLIALPLHAQTGENDAKAQEDFALAVAKAHSRTSLFASGAKPVAIQASVVSRLALHGTGKGTYENRWVDAQHWQRIIRFPDFQDSEMRNDSGHSWVERSNEAVPIRMEELLRVVVIHVPSSTTAASFHVSESATTGERGVPVTCFAATIPLRPDGFPRSYRWCFDTASGLLVSEDLPLDIHITYGSYIAFQGKQEFTEAHVTVSGLPVLDMNIQYAPLDPHALDSLAPGAGMHRSASAGATANPEEQRRGTVEYRYSPPLPVETPEAAKDKPVDLLFHVGADNTLLDASVERAPTLAMGEAALEGVSKFTFTPLTVDGKAAANIFYYPVWFQTGAAGGVQSKAGGVYRDKELSFTFRYPDNFELIPRGQLEEEQRHVADTAHSYGLDPHKECNTLLFKAQRKGADGHSVQVLSILEQDSNCIFVRLDRQVLETMAANAVQSVAVQLLDAKVSKPKEYKINGRTFAVVSGSGTGRGTIAEPLNLVVVVTNIRDHLVGWLIVGPDVNVAQALENCLLQVGEEREDILLPPSYKP